jgi:hypothetical protein
VVKSANGCTATSDVVVTADVTPPVIVTSNIMPVCGATTADLGTGITTNTGISTDFYSDAGLTATVAAPSSVTSAATYYTKITAANGCTSTSSLDVTPFRPIPTATTATAPPCGGTSYVLDASGSTSGVSFAWTTTDGIITADANTAMPTVSTAGTYQVSVTMNGCSSIAAVTIVCALPVKLLHFKGEIVGKTNVLDWQTATEINSQAFWIERSDDGVSFKMIGVQTAAGTSSDILKYQFVDTNPNAKCYYRLRMVDRDGSFEYSNVITLNRKMEYSSIISLYPNPTSATVNLSYTIPTNGIVTIYIVDLLGREVFSTKANQLAGIYNQNIDLTELSGGMYFVILEAENRRTVREIIKK